MRRVSLCVLAAAVVLVAGQSRAFSVEEAWTITTTPFSITAGNVTAAINPVDPLFVNNGLSALQDGVDHICLAGTCEIINQDWLVFSVTATGAGSLDGLGVTLLGNPLLSALGMGYFLDGGMGTADTYTASLAVPTAPVFNFVADGGGAGLTGTSLVLFVAYADGVMPHISEVPYSAWGDNVVNFMVTPYGGGSAVTNHQNFLTSVQVVPEPGTALLLGLGFVALGARARRRRS